MERHARSTRVHEKKLQPYGELADKQLPGNGEKTV